MNCDFQMIDIATEEDLDTVMGHREGMVAFIEDVQEYRVYLNGEWRPVEEQSAENGGLALNLYEVNRQIVSQLPNFSEEQKKDFKTALSFWIDPEVNYYLLMGQETSTSMLFVREAGSEESLVDLLYESFDEIGLIKDYEIIDENALEVWMDCFGLVSCFYLVNYENGVRKFK
jgi:hypothetical protein